MLMPIAIPSKVCLFSYCLVIVRKIYDIKTKTENTQNLYFLTNIDKPQSLNLLKYLYKIKINHWLVESWHKTKDVLFQEDSYYKSFIVAVINSLKINLIYWIASQLNMKLTKQNIKKLRDYLSLVLLINLFNLGQYYSIFSINSPIDY